MIKKQKIVVMFRKACLDRECVACKHYYKNVSQDDGLTPCDNCWQAKLCFTPIKTVQAFQQRLIDNTQDENWLEDYAETLR